MPQLPDKPTQEELTRWMSGMGPREWQRWLELGGWMPDLMEIARCRIEQATAKRRKEAEIIGEIERELRNEKNRACKLRKKFRDASRPSPACAPLPKKSAG